MQLLKCTIIGYSANFSKYKKSLHQAVTLVLCEITYLVSVFTYNFVLWIMSRYIEAITFAVKAELLGKSSFLG